MIVIVIVIVAETSVISSFSVCLCVHTIEPAGLCLQTVEQILVSSRSSSLDGEDKTGRECRVTVAQLGQLHRERCQPPTKHFTPSWREKEEEGQLLQTQISL